MSLSDTQRTEILILLGYGDKTRTQKQVCEIFSTKYSDHRISQSTVSRIENKFREFGNATDIPKSAHILLDIQDNPHKPTREVAADNDVKLNDDDPDRRLEFCEIMANRCQDNPLFIKKILFSDEATFVVNGTVNKQNCIYWSTEYPHWMVKANTQYSEKVNVWDGIINSQIIGPYFFDGTLTGARYLDFLQNVLVPELRMLFPDDDNPNEIDRNIWFQQDGAIPHFSLARHHRSEKEVVNALQWPKGSKERRQALSLLRNATNFDLYITGIRSNERDEIAVVAKKDLLIAHFGESYMKNTKESDWRMHAVPKCENFLVYLLDIGK
ncbi:hypothetical protein NQ318_007619 [Aromia moschata]|uniref:Uncharacterized protein n=1 Tax=Aromia moschata TaxID=1265417 RepID=A0AAV8X2F5_9CUCU|nr:hypothetical protein NQ318_007619 [Aromia moschata]